MGLDSGLKARDPILKKKDAAVHRSASNNNPLEIAVFMRQKVTSGKTVKQSDLGRPDTLSQIYYGRYITARRDLRHSLSNKLE